MQSYIVSSTEHSFDDVPFEDDFETASKDLAKTIATTTYSKALVNCKHVTVTVTQKSDNDTIYKRTTP